MFVECLNLMCSDITFHCCVCVGSEAAAAGLQPGQCVLKVNGANVSQSSYEEVLEHFSSYQPEQDEKEQVRSAGCCR